MAQDAVIAARLDLIAAKARILAEKYKSNQLWTGELDKQLNEIKAEIVRVFQDRGVMRLDRSGTWYPDDK
jgi:hypothetical protein